MSTNNLLAAIPVCMGMLFFSSCGEIIPNFSDTPKIDFDKVEVKQLPGMVSDSVIITIKFQDGDGDLGIEATADTNQWNYFITAYKKFRNEYIPVRFLDASSYNAFSRGFVPVLKKDGRKGPIEGTLRYGPPPLVQRLDFPLTPEDSMEILNNDTLFFKVRVKDQAGHMSNEIETSKVRVLIPR